MVFLLLLRLSFLAQFLLVNVSPIMTHVSLLSMPARLCSAAQHVELHYQALDSVVFLRRAWGSVLACGQVTAGHFHLDEIASGLSQARSTAAGTPGLCQPHS